jgi:hypothetical protein
VSSEDYRNRPFCCVFRRVIGARSPPGCYPGAITFDRGASGTTRRFKSLERGFRSNSALRINPRYMPRHNHPVIRTPAQRGRALVREIILPAKVVAHVQFQPAHRRWVRSPLRRPPYLANRSGLVYCPAVAPEPGRPGRTLP